MFTRTLRPFIQPTRSSGQHFFSQKIIQRNADLPSSQPIEANLESIDKAKNPTNESRGKLEKEVKFNGEVFLLSLEATKSSHDWFDNERNNGGTMGPY